MLGLFLGFSDTVPDAVLLVDNTATITPESASASSARGSGSPPMWPPHCTLRVLVRTRRSASALLSAERAHIVDYAGALRGMCLIVVVVGAHRRRVRRPYDVDPGMCTRARNVHDAASRAYGHTDWAIGLTRP